MIDPASKLRHTTALLTITLAITCLTTHAGSTTAASASDATAGASNTVSSTTTVRFTTGRKYVVSTRIGTKVVRGKGKLPSGLVKSNVDARPANNVLGVGSVEVLMDYGPAIQDMSAHVYSLHTAHRGKLRPVTLNGRQVVLATYTEGGDDGGFLCKGGRLLTHWYHHGSQQGEQTAYRLVGNRLKQESQKPIRRAVTSRPESCA